MYTRLTRDTYVNIHDVLAFDFKGALWGRDPDAKLFVETVVKQRCILHLTSGATLAFELEGNQRPEDIVALLTYGEM